MHQSREQRLEAAMQLAAKEIQVLSDPTTKIYPAVKEKIDKFLNNGRVTSLPISDITKSNDKRDYSPKHIQYGPLAVKSEDQENDTPNITNFTRNRTFSREDDAYETENSLSNRFSFSGYDEPTIRSRRSVFTKKSSIPSTTAKEFIVPVKKGSEETTKTGLKLGVDRHRTDFEKMRIESDKRLENAILKSIREKEKQLLMTKKQTRKPIRSKPRTPQQPEFTELSHLTDEVLRRIVLTRDQPTTLEAKSGGHPLIAFSNLHPEPSPGVLKYIEIQSAQPAQKELNQYEILEDFVKMLSAKIEPMLKTVNNTPDQDNQIEDSMITAPNHSIINTWSNIIPETTNSRRQDRQLRIPESLVGRIQSSRINCSERRSTVESIKKYLQLTSVSKKLVDEMLDAVIIEIQTNCDAFVDSIVSEEFDVLAK